MGGVFVAGESVRIGRERWVREEQLLARLGEAFVRSIQTRLVIPDETSWSAALAEVTGLNQTTLEYVHPSFPSDPSTRRVLIFDAGLPVGVLPYFQAGGQLTAGQSSLLGPKGRAMLVSSTRRGAVLPIKSGHVDSNFFDSLWSWVYDPQNPTTPAGWPAEWAGQGDALHVARISFAPLFARVELNHVQYTLRSSFQPGTESGAHLVVSPLSLMVLKGSMLAISGTNGTPYRRQVVRSDCSFDLTPAATNEVVGNGTSL